MSEPRLAPSSRVQRSSRALIHALAECQVCEWSDGDCLGAARAATRHARETHHTVTVEQGVSYVVRIKEDE
jgi:hypothetical protein